ncbi:hypothetical protein [Sellimonas caecigallum]|uniref:Uncharacterized protein n=1 Tax=Sellimonas caecigallum TaxID=2592333 RepID=A0ABS7L9J9_9FIRM|nr:hypothetical protein [Sellimonas caecigallum]MBY0759776.1 hypothetical protein [Sellimonas caecigallum]
MKKKVGILLAGLLVVLAVIGGKQLIIDDSQVENTSSLTKEQETRKDPGNLYGRLPGRGITGAGKGKTGRYLYIIQYAGKGKSIWDEHNVALCVF